MKSDKKLSDLTGKRHLARFFDCRSDCERFSIMRVRTRYSELNGLRRGIKYIVPAVLIAFGFGLPDAEAGGRRVAFVIGNSGYQSVPSLPNPKNDAAAVATALKKSGFEVVSAIDLDRVGFDQAFEKFVRSLGGADMSVFYYSGHGIQVGGDNRIIPTDAQLKSAADLEVETVSVKTIMSYMKSNSKLQLVFLDSCRNNPFPASSFLVGPEKQMLVAGVGLAAQDSPLGSMVAFSTQPGAVAIDGQGDHSPFTASMLSHTFKLGVDVKTALAQVTDDVWQATEQKQKPWSSDSLGQAVFFKVPAIRLAPAEPVVASKEPAVKIAAAPTQDAPAAATAPVNQIAEILSQALSKPHRVPIGVGQVAMLDNFPIVRAAGADQIEVTAVPKSGTLYLDGNPLGEGDVLNGDALRKVTFEPAIDSNEKIQEFGLKVADAGSSTSSNLTGKIEPFIVACDEEAGEPLDLQGVTAGKLPNEINPDTAIAACTDAVAKFPAVARYKYELGRAELAAKNTKDALTLFQQAADGGHVRAFDQLGYMAQGGYGRNQDLAEANTLFKSASDQGDPYGMLDYGRNLSQGRGVAKDIDEGIRLLNKSVEMGHTYAMNELGSMYFYGKGVKLNPQRGVRFYEAALARDDIYAMRNLALAYQQGKGVGKDLQKAKDLFEKASDGGHPQAPTDLGAMYFNGTGVAKDTAVAVKWYTLGAERGDYWAASNLAFIYGKGPAKMRDAQKAVEYAGLAVALDRYGETPKNKDFLKSLPVEGKRGLIKSLIGQVGAENAQTGSDLDETLVLLSRQAWRARNPRLDLF
jgi:TPR repeat protein